MKFVFPADLMKVQWCTGIRHRIGAQLCLSPAPLPWASRLTFFFLSFIKWESWTRLSYFPELVSEQMR